MTVPEEFQFSVRTLESRDQRSDFSCGNLALDQYFKKQIGQDCRKGVAVAFVLVDEKCGRVAGFYTLSATSILLSDLPPETAKRLPKYPRVPATLIGRLAVDLRYRGQKLGEFMLMDAMRRSLEASREVGSMAVIVDSKDAESKAFYRRYGFIELVDDRYRLFLSLKTIESLF